jgi:hypothetical protein
MEPDNRSPNLTQGGNKERYYSLTAMHELVAQIDKCHATFLSQFEQMLDAAAGVKLENADELVEFRDAFSAITKRLGVRPLQSDGTPGSLQVDKNRPGKAWAKISATKKNRTCGVPANTIPSITLGEPY